MRGFDDVASSFEKNGIDLSEDEVDVIRSFIESSAISDSAPIYPPFFA